LQEVLSVYVSVEFKFALYSRYVTLVQRIGIRSTGRVIVKLAIGEGRRDDPWQYSMVFLIPLTDASVPAGMRYAIAAFSSGSWKGEKVG